MRRTTWAVALLIALMTGAADALRAQQTDTVLVWDVPVELRTLSPEVARVFVECPMAYVSESGVEDALGVFRSEEVAVTPTRLGGYVSDRIQVAVTTSDLLGPPRGPPLGNYLIHCELFLVGPIGRSVRPWYTDDPNRPPGTPDWAIMINPADGVDYYPDPTKVALPATSQSGWGQRMHDAWIAATGGAPGNNSPQSPSPGGVS